MLYVKERGMIWGGGSQADHRILTGAGVSVGAEETAVRVWDSIHHYFS